MATKAACHEDPAMPFLRAATFSCISPPIFLWPEGFLAASPELCTDGNGTLEFDGTSQAGWYKSGFNCRIYREELAGHDQLVVKFQTALSSTVCRQGSYFPSSVKGPFVTRDRGNNYDRRPTERDYEAMFDDYQQQKILSMLSYLYASKTKSADTPRIAYLLPLLVKAESNTHTWYGIIEKSLPTFKKPTSWQRTKWQYKESYIKFRKWCKKEYGVRLDDPQGLYLEGDWLFLTDGIVHCRSVKSTCQELQLALEKMNDSDMDEVSTACLSSYSCTEGSETEEFSEPEAPQGSGEQLLAWPGLEVQQEQPPASRPVVLMCGAVMTTRCQPIIVKL
eukprot:TRINITY_DN33600_c0_g1_i1.p1 TRINITY_DN33600_c0_g1~~TRINITY_DN33600_c0_g1_i1.p1  ORF type:complete len:335 (+),score=49.27 TRINITY_DN33600_c0_g1_i1:135-1139(+)